MSSGFQPSQAFESAAKYLSALSVLTRVPNATKLELYGLFKYLTASREPTTSRPSIFDMTNRAKWDAWKATGSSYTQPEAVQARYIEIARTLGWTEEVVVTKSHSDEDEDINWDEDDESVSADGDINYGPGDGMIVGVSSIQPPPTLADNSIHGLAISNDVQSLERLLIEQPNIDIDQLDQYGYTPLHLACDRGNIDVARILLSRGCDPSIKDPDNLSPLELAKEAGKAEIVALLLQSA